MVSAPSILNERGIDLKESTTCDSPTYESLIRIRVRVDGKWRTVAGSIVNDQPRIVEVKGMALDAKFRPFILFVNNTDKPGFIGALGSLLGEAGINIATFNLGREEEAGDAIAMVGIDQDISDDVMKKINALSFVRYAKVLRF